jgi:hypothetical protein
LKVQASYSSAQKWHRNDAFQGTCLDVLNDDLNACTPGHGDYTAADQANFAPMASITPNPKKRSYLLPPGCKDLIDVLKGPPAKPSLATKVRLNGQIRAPELRVIGEDGHSIAGRRLGTSTVAWR